MILRRISDIFLGCRLWIFIAKVYWTVYGFVLPGWRKQYAVYMRRKASSIKACRKYTKQFVEIMEAHRRELMPNPVIKRFREFDYMLCKLFLGADPDSNYFYLDYYKYGPILRNTFVTAKRIRFIDRYLNDPKTEAFCRDKPSAALYWAKWFKRRWTVKERNVIFAADRFGELFGSCNKIIVKPVDGYGGHGIVVLPVGTETEKEEALAAINSYGESCIIEEFIEQKGFLHELNPSSLNTVRMISVKHTDGTVEPLFGVLRVGRAGAIVDNISSGGISFDVDIKTGEILMGSDYNGNHYSDHPGNGAKISGNHVPAWQDFLKFCISAHETAPQGLNIAAWDVCVSDDGLYLLEVNGQPGIACRRPREIDAWGKFKKILDEYCTERKKREIGS